MAKFELKLPKMGESVAEATITNWLKNVGDSIAADEAVLEIATDKVDSEVPSEVTGTLTEILFQVNDVVKVGQTIAIIETEGGAPAVTAPPTEWPAHRPAKPGSHLSRYSGTEMPVRTAQWWRHALWQSFQSLHGCRCHSM